MKKRNSIFSLILKVNFIVSLLLLLLVSNSFAQEISFSNPWGPNGMTLNKQGASGVEVNFSIDKLYLQDVYIDGMNMKSVKFTGVFLPSDPGNPDLGGTGRYIAIPQGSQVSYKIISSRTEVYKNIEIAPAPNVPLDNDPTPLKYTKNQQVYSKNMVFPENPVIISSISQIRGVDAVILGITPFQYNPVTKELVVYRDMKVQLNFIGGNGHFGNDAFRSRWWEPILSDAILNYTSLPVLNFENKNNNDATGYEYVIISPNSSVFTAWADSVKRFRIQQGIKTGVFKLSDIGGNNVTTIKNWVANIYNTWTIKPAAIMLLGDYGTDANINIISKLEIHPDGYPNYANDNWYADVNNDTMPDIVFSRIAANDASQLQIMISKFINYEKNPPTSANFYLHPITALGWQTERWFQICSEAVGGFFRKILNKQPVRINKIYLGTPGTVWSTNGNTSMVVNYFGTVGRGYFPMTPDSLGGWDGGNATMVNNAINAGAFLLQHRDHGSYTGWGEPSYSISNISGLTNTDLTFVFTINCETGAFQYNPVSFGEAFHRYTYNGQNSGALGFVGPTETSYSFVNDTYAWGMYDNMWPNFMPDYGTTPPSRDLKPAFGMAAGKYFLKQSNWPNIPEYKDVTYRLFHMHGDAFLNLYSEVPQNLAVSHNPVILSGISTFDVTANAGSFIAITMDTTILGTGTGTGSPLAITIPGTQIPGDTLKITITKQNYYRYNSSVSVIPPSGPYCVKDSVAINDASPLGNGNGLMDYGETNKLALRLKNVGSVVANGVNVKVTTTNTYITMTDSLEVFGNINAGATMFKTDAFAYTVANNIPEGTTVNFVVTATSGSENWVSYFDLTSHAPVMKLGSIQITDSTGNNNGRIDPGETVKMKITFKNIGSSTANNVIGRLFENSPYLTVNGDSLNYGTINYGDSVRKSFNVTALSNTPLGTPVKFTVNMIPALRQAAIDTFNVVVGLNVFNIGSGTTSCDFPFTTYWMDGRTDMLYTASELSSAGCFIGNITKIGFDVLSADPGVMNGFNIKIQSTNVSSISGFTTTGWTTCYSGAYTVPGTGWQFITLQNPFYWDGTSNILIEVCYNNSAYTHYSPVNSTTLTNMVYGRYGDLSTADGCATTSWSSTTSPAGRPNLGLNMQSVTGIGNSGNDIPATYNLSQNYPNPFNPTTRIEYAIPKQGLVNINIYDVLGRLVSTLVNEVKKAGYYSVEFNAINLSSGVYYYRLESGSFIDTKKLMLIK
jgi:hypothetical protein